MSVISIALLPFVFGFMPALIGGNQSNRWVRKLTTDTLMLSFMLSLILGVLFFSTGQMIIDEVFFLFGSREAFHVSLGVYYDSVSALMTILVSFLGWMVSRYSVRYLDGDSDQAQFFKWLSFVMSSILLLIISRNLVMLLASWMSTSYGLHQLLTYYRTKDSLLVARKKFIISRIGDLFLIAGLVATYSVFHTFEYSEIFKNAAQMASEHSGARFSALGLLFVLGAMTKSAQFPFHTWLPDTMDAPTPVSALMHAGIINAGGFLVIRLSPLIVHAPLALDFLAGIGGITALLGVLVMMTQTDVKRSLAYSTVAQMGFMMLQCGLGAFAAATLHILCHALYKAHAFLRTGSMVEAISSGKKTRHQGQPGNFRILGALSVTLAWLTALVFLLHVNMDKPGIQILSLFTVLGLAQLVVSTRKTGIGVMLMMITSTTYVLIYHALEMTFARTLPLGPDAFGFSDALVFTSVAMGFCMIFILQNNLKLASEAKWVRILAIHAFNGFYIAEYFNRIIGTEMSHRGEIK